MQAQVGDLRLGIALDPGAQEEPVGVIGDGDKTQDELRGRAVEGKFRVALERPPAAPIILLLALAEVEC